MDGGIIDFLDIRIVKELPDYLLDPEEIGPWKGIICIREIYFPDYIDYFMNNRVKESIRDAYAEAVLAWCQALFTYRLLEREIKKRRKNARQNIKT